jgi:hypothetical protein
MPVDESGGTYFADDGSALDPDAATVVDDAPDDVRTDDDPPDDVRTDDDAPDDVRTDEVRQTGELDDAAAGPVDPDRGHLDESAEDDQVGDSSGRSADDEPADPS